MAKSKKRGGEKEHRKRVEKRNKQLKQDLVAIEALKRKIYEEAKQRMEEQKNNNITWQTIV
jgi:hypothetical protein